jgi:hypothetical protein
LENSDQHKWLRANGQWPEKIRLSVLATGH